ncbi:hypothetical protein BDQ17DRAFT_1426983 [Cyathus striatus]|nr:hypothetical protein BDQ17DRAFT_1426983 [Cyathus striatus]
MDEFTPLARPTQSPVTVDPSPRQPESDGFNYPTFRLLNKQARTTLSDPINTHPSNYYRLFTVANSRGWFAAATFLGSSYEIILSTLEDLRATIKVAKAGNDDRFKPKRSLSLSDGKPNIIVFASNDTHLVIGLEDGSILVYDTAQLFTIGTEDISPVHVSLSSSGDLRQVVPNPGIDPSLADLVAIVRDDGTVQLVNTQLENQGGWTSGGNGSLKPVAASWSPKGKHLAIGLQGGDILTFSPGNMATFNKYIPPTYNGVLVSLDWIGPAHTFRTSYAPRAPNTSDPSHHILMLDTKSSTATYVALNFPFSLPDRPQHSFIMTLPKWDEDSATSSGDKALIVVGDSSAVDLEVIAHSGNQWYQESQENPLSLPLDKDMNDTMLLSLEADLTDSDAGAPIIYAYLNDGTIQGWHTEHSKPYVGLVTPNSNVQHIVQPSHNDLSMSITTTQPLGPALGQSNTPGFGQSSAFGQASFGSNSNNTFGGLSSFSTQPPAGGGFGAFASSGNSSPFGKPSESAISPPFGGGTSQQPSVTPFGGNAATTFDTVGSAGPSVNAFSAFSSSSGSGNVFGQPSFGFAASSVPPETTGGGTFPTAPTITREASMQDSTPSFGGLSLGGESDNDSKPKNNAGIFGSFGSSTPAKAEPVSAFGNIVKPATGFGAFSNFKTPSASVNTTNNAPAKAESSSFLKPATGFGAFGDSQMSSASTISATPSTSQPASHSSFGTSSFGKAAFGQSAFGQSSFGQTGFGNATSEQTSFGKAALPTTSSGGFSAFSSKPSSFAAVVQQAPSTNKPASTTASSGGFSAFASGAAAGFGANSKGSSSSSSQDPPKTPAAGLNAPSSSASSSPISSSTVGTTTPDNSQFGIRETTTPVGSPAKPLGIASPSSSPESSPTFRSTTPLNSTASVSSFKSSSLGTGTGAFGNLHSSPSPFKPTSGFGAFGSDQITSSNSPFFKKPETSTPPASIFAGAQPSVMQGSTTPSNSPAFGSTSLIGKNKSVLPSTPTTSTPIVSSQTSAFSAFSGSSTGFSSLAGQKKSFSELLKSDVDSKDPIKPSTTPAVESKAKPIFGATSVSVFAPPRQMTSDLEKEAQEQVEKPGIKKEESTDTISEEPVNISSASSSSFVEVNAEDVGENEKGKDGDEREEGEVDEDEDDEGEGESEGEDEDEDDSSFLSDSVKSHGSSDVSSDEESENEDSEEESSATQSILEAIKTPLPMSRSPSSTPQPEAPRIDITPSPSPSEEGSSSPKTSEPSKSSGRETSTTPPGTPTKEVTPVFSKPSVSSPPIPASPPVTPSPFGLGPGRHSTRPARSSPLASTPVSGDDDDDEEEGEDDNDDEETENTARITSVPSIKPLVSPKPVVSSLSMKLEVAAKTGSPDEVSPTSRRPKTPPLLSLTGKVPAMPSTPVLAHAVPPGRREATTPAFPPLKPTVVPPVVGAESSTGSVPPSSFFANPLSTAAVKPEPSLNSLFGSSTKPAAPSLVPSTSVFGGSTFNLKGIATPSPVPSVPPGGLFRGTSQQPEAVSSPNVFGKPSAPFFQPAQQGFMSKPIASTSIFPLGSSSVNLTGHSILKPSIPAAPPTIPETTMEIGMQKECARLIDHLERELANLKGLAQAASSKRIELGKPAGGLPKKVDLGNTSKWTLSDVSQFGQVLRQYEKDLSELRNRREDLRQAVRDLQGTMLKATTRKEEISRFDKAKNDTDFAKMLRSRTLGPEHLESQTQLRRSIRNMRDRIQNLESNLRASKKRVAQFSTGKPGLKAPSLDTINRTYRNIDIAIEQQSHTVSKLASRITELDIGGSKTPKKNTRDARLPDTASRRPNVTPSVATTTAAALNAERSAHNLKRALLSIRSVPLLNKEAASAPPAPVVFNTPQKSEDSTLSFEFKTPIKGPIFSVPVQSAVTPPSNWSLPDDDFSPTVWTPTQRRAGGSGQKKHGSVALKRSPGMSPTPAASAFDWGPLPKFDNIPLNPLAASVKIDPGKNSNPN